MEPPPKQGCEVSVSIIGSGYPGLSGTPAEAGVRDLEYFPEDIKQVVSVEPPPKQGCEPSRMGRSYRCVVVSVEPPPKQGCENTRWSNILTIMGLSGTPAEAGVRDLKLEKMYQWARGLSGTPAEAGVRVEGSELHAVNFTSQWNPRRSRGARRLL